MNELEKENNELKDELEVLKLDYIGLESLKNELHDKLLDCQEEIKGKTDYINELVYRLGIMGQKLHLTRAELKSNF